MREPADADHVDAATCNLEDVLGRHSAAGLGNHTPAHDANGLRKLRHGHVVEQDRVDWLVERIAQLLERVDLDFDLDHVTDGGARRRDGCMDRTGDAEMIVFDQHAVIQTKAVIGTAATRNRVSLERT